MARTLQASVLLDDKQAKAALHNLEAQGKKTAQNISANFKEIGKGLAPDISKFIGPLAVAAVALAAVGAAAKLVASAFNEWKEKEQAIYRVNSALSATNQLTNENTTAIIANANAIESKTTYDDAEVLALNAKVIAITGNTAARGMDIQITNTAMALSQMYGISEETAARQITKAIEGKTNALIKGAIVIKEGGTAQERADQITLAAIPGMKMMENETNTIDGATKQLKNTYGGLLETLAYSSGITMPAVVEAIKGIGFILTVVGNILIALTQTTAAGTNNIQTSFGNLFEGVGTIAIRTIEYVAKSINQIMALVALGNLGLSEIGLANINMKQAKFDLDSKFGGPLSDAQIAKNIQYQKDQDYWRNQYKSDIDASKQELNDISQRDLDISAAANSGVGALPGWSAKISKGLDGTPLTMRQIIDLLNPDGEKGGGGGKKAKEDTAQKALEEYAKAFNSMLNNPKLADAKAFFGGQLKDLAKLKDDQIQLNKEVTFYENKLNKLKQTGANKDTIKTVEEELKVRKEAVSLIQKEIDIKIKNIDLAKSERQAAIDSHKQIIDYLNNRISKEKELQDQLKTNIADTREIMNMLNPGSVSTGGMEDFIAKINRINPGLLTGANEAYMRSQEQSSLARGFGLTDEDRAALMKQMGFNASDFMTPFQQMQDQLTKSIDKTTLWQQTVDINTRGISALTQQIYNLDSTIRSLKGLPPGTAPLSAAQLEKAANFQNVGPQLSYPSVPPLPSSNGAAGVGRKRMPSDWSAPGWVKVSCNQDGSDTCNYEYIGEGVAAGGSPGVFVGAAEKADIKNKGEKAEADAKKAEDEAKKKAEEAKRRQEVAMAPFYNLINSGISGIGSEGGFGAGLEKGAGPFAGSLVSGFIPGPLGGLLGNLASKLIGNMFGKSHKAPTKVEPVPVRVINFSDMQSALLNVTKQMMLGMTSGNINRLDNLRLAQNTVGIRR